MEKEENAYYKGYGNRTKNWEDLLSDGDFKGVLMREAYPPSWEDGESYYVRWSARKSIADSQKAQAMLSHLLLEYWGEWRPKSYKAGFYSIKGAFVSGTVLLEGGFCEFIDCFLIFPTEQMRDDFLEDHRDLIIQYFKMYEW